MSAAMLCSAAAPAFAADVLVRTEPNKGFTLGDDPEWGSTHETSASNMGDHRQYHRNAETARVLWLTTHASERGTSAYNAALRTMLQNRNLSHRLYHLGLTIQDTLSTSSSSSWSSSSKPATSSSSSMSSSKSSSSSSAMSSSSSSHSMMHSSSSSSQAAANQGQATVNLGAAGTFGVLAGSTVTNIGPTSVAGDVGVSAGSAVTGFPPAFISGGGAIHAADTLAAEAQSSLTVAYNNLAGRTVNPVSVSGNLGGSTLSPGLYKSTSGLEISSGDLTLDGKGDPNAIFIFQIATTLDVSVGRSVVLMNGAKASNVFWQVGTSANLGANSVFKGSILADQSISLQTGANVQGRLLARIGGVTMQSNVINVPN